MSEDQRQTEPYSYGAILAALLIAGFTALGGSLWAIFSEELPPVTRSAVMAALLLAAILLLRAYAARGSSPRLARLHAVRGVLTAVVSLVFALALRPDAPELRWYEAGSGSQLQLLKGDTFAVDQEVRPGEILEIPMRLAVVNPGWKPLTDVRVEVSYPDKYEVIPQGEQLIAPQGGQTYL